MVYSSDTISFFILIKDIRDFRRQIGISLFDRIGFADFVIVCRPGQSGCLQQLIQRVSFSSEFVDECSFFALSCAANFSCLKAIRFFITSFSVRKYSFSALSRISFFSLRWGQFCRYNFLFHVVRLLGWPSFSLCSHVPDTLSFIASDPIETRDLAQLLQKSRSLLLILLQEL